MLKLDFEHKSYSFSEIADALSAGSIDNFKGDEDFLEFLISYGVGNLLEGPASEDFKEYAKYDGMLNIMRLDEYGYFGSPLYRIYEICGKDKLKFIRTCDLIGFYSIKHSIEKETIDRNLSLKEPVDFVDENIVLNNGIKPIYNLDEHILFRSGLKLSDEREYDYEIERSLRRRINESIKKNGDDVPLLEEIVSYVEKGRLEEEAKEQKKVPDDYEININNLFFGSEEMDISGCGLGITMRSVSWFENTNMNMLNLHVFRSVPMGDYCLLDNAGKVHIPEEVIKKENINVGPEQTIRKVNIVNVPKIINNAVSVLEEDYGENEEAIATCKSFLEMLEYKETLSVSEIKEHEPFIRRVYEIAYGDMFDNDDDKNYAEVDENTGPHK